MDFAAVMLFNQQVSRLECLLFHIKSQPDVAFKSVDYKKTFNVIFQSSKNKEITFPHKFIFEVYFIS